MPTNRLNRVVIVVLGEIGQSPRMQFHAEALAECGIDVEIVAFTCAPIPTSIVNNPRISLQSLSPPRVSSRHRLPKFLFIVYSAIRIVVGAVQLLWTLLARTGKPDLILVQNPPAIPTLAIAAAAARLRAAHLIIDWHNYGFSMLACRVGRASAFVGFAEWYEGYWGRSGYRHLCVSNAMKDDLRLRWGIENTTVFHDKPAAIFMDTRTDRKEPERREARRGRLPTLVDLPASLDLDRAAILVSPTSWTIDEDFSMLFTALEAYEKCCTTTVGGHTKWPHLLIILTGKGPLREHYETRIGSLDLTRVTVLTAWLPERDYALLLGFADLGLCFHRSSSGLDLPMKIVDMFGAGLPVCAYDYGSCLRELVNAGETGYLFNSSAQLAQQWISLFEGYPQRTLELSRMRNTVRETHQMNWNSWWRVTTKAVFRIAS